MITDRLNLLSPEEFAIRRANVERKLGIMRGLLDCLEGADIDKTVKKLTITEKVKYEEV